MHTYISYVFLQNTMSSLHLLNWLPFFFWSKNDNLTDLWSVKVKFVHVVANNFRIFWWNFLYNCTSPNWQINKQIRLGAFFSSKKINIYGKKKQPSIYFILVCFCILTCQRTRRNNASTIMDFAHDTDQQRQLGRNSSTKLSSDAMCGS